MKHPHHSPGADASFPQEKQVVFEICQRMGGELPSDGGCSNTMPWAGEEHGCYEDGDLPLWSRV